MFFNQKSKQNIINHKLNCSISFFTNVVSFPCNTPNSTHKTLAPAPAHEHDLLALHRHGHKWGGLPLLFWVVLGTLIAIFHLFLLKLVYNEYCRNQDLRGFPGFVHNLILDDFQASIITVAIE